MSTKASILCLAMTAVIAVTVIVLFYLLPFRSDGIELVFTIISLGGVPLCIFLMILTAIPLRRTKYGPYALYAMVLPLGLASALSVFRQDIANQYRWDVHGVVIKKYIDTHQHNYPTIEVHTDQGDDVILRAISQSAYVFVHVHSRIDKNAWSPMALIGKHNINMIE